MGLVDSLGIHIRLGVGNGDGLVGIVLGLGLGILIVHLVRSLRSRTARHRVVNHVGDPADDSGSLAEVRVEDGQNVANASRDLQAVANADQAVVAWIGRERVLLHHHLASGRQGVGIAEARLGKHAQFGAALLATRAALDAAAHGELALEALVLPHVALEELVSEVVLSASHRPRQILTKEPAPRRRALDAGRVNHAGLEAVGGLIRLASARRVLHGVTRDDAAHLAGPDLAL